MNTNTLTALAGLAAAASIAAAGGIQPVLVTTSGFEAPGLLGELFDTNNFTFSTPTVDENGNVAFRARIFDALPANERGIWRGGLGTLELIARDGDQAAGVAAGITYNAVSSNNPTAGLRDPRLTSNGGMVFGSRLWSTTGQVTTGVDDSALYYVPSGTTTPTLLARRGQVVTGSGAMISSSLESLNPLDVNASGQVVIKTNLTGGDVSGTTNNEAILALDGGAVSVVARKGDATPIGGTTFNSLGFARQGNAIGQFAFDATLTGATSDSDSVIFRGNFAGGPLTVLAREGDVVTGDGAVLSGSIQPAPLGFNRHGKTAFVSTISGGSVTADDNQGIFIADGNSIDLVVRKGIAAAGTDGIASVIFNSDARLNDRNNVAYRVALSGGTVDTTNDNALYILYGATNHLIAREGDFIDALGGTISGTLGQMFLNNNGDVVFTAQIAGSSLTTSALLTWDLETGVSVVAYRGQQIEVLPGVFRTLNNFSTNNSNNGDGRALGFSDSGIVTWASSYVEGGQGVFTALVPAPASVGLLALAGFAAGRRRR